MKLIRTSSGRFRAAAVLSCFLVAAGLVSFASQPPEEEEAPKTKPKKKIIVDDPDPPMGAPRPAGGNPPDKRLDELDGAAAEAKNPAVKKLLASYAVPFDRIVEKTETLRVSPIPRRWKKDTFPANKQFPVTPLDGTGKLLPLKQVAIANIKSIEPYELVVMAEVESWLKQRPLGSNPGPDDLTPAEQLAAAEKLLAAAYRYHTAVRPSGVRKGKSWDDIQQPLYERWRDLNIEQLRTAVAAGDWQNVRKFSTRLMNGFPKDAKVSKEVARAVVGRAEDLMKSNAHADRVEARGLLDDFEAKYPGEGMDLIRPLRKQLTDEAARLYNQAELHKKAGNAVDARNELDRAEALDPNLPGLRDLKREIGSGYPVLYVGVRQFPELMSPATARFDSERQAVELLFDGLLNEVPDANGGSGYRAGAAIGFPTMLPAGRELLFRQSSPSRERIDGFQAQDVVETIKMLRSRPDLGISAGLPWFSGLPIPTGNGSLRINFAHGHPDPRSLLTFKILPGRYLAEKGKTLTAKDFALKPFGSGPFRINSLPPVGESGPRELIFVDNPAFGGHLDRKGQPHLREIRFVELSRLADPFDDFRRGRLHILPDLSPEELKKALQQGNEALGGKGTVVTSENQRRVHILAVNHQRSVLQSLDLRKGISSAIDRDGILAEFYKVENLRHRKLTAAMTGPYPPRSWATGKNGPLDAPAPLVDRADAAVRLKRFLDARGGETALTLAYSTADPHGQAIGERIKSQVESLGDKRLIIKLDPCTPQDLHRKVFEVHDYDLAYIPIDYPDDWYPFGLAAMLDPSAATLGGRNFTGFLGEGTNPSGEEHDLNGELASLIQHRDFEEIKKRAIRIHRSFNACVPFIPLWQLDRHMLVSSRLKVYLDGSDKPAPMERINPSLLFQNVGRWKLE